MVERTKLERVARIAIGGVLLALGLWLLAQAVFSFDPSELGALLYPLVLSIAFLLPGILLLRRPKSSGTPSRGKANRGTKSLVFATLAVLLTWTQFLTFIGVGFAVAAAVYGVLGIRSAKEDRRGLWTSIAGLSIGVVGPGVELWLICSRGC